MKRSIVVILALLVVLNILLLSVILVQANPTSQGYQGQRYEYLFMVYKDSAYTVTSIFPPDDEEMLEAFEGYPGLQFKFDIIGSEGWQYKDRFESDDSITYIFERSYSY